MKHKVLICATVPETLATNLRGQPGYLKQFFDVELVTSPHAEFRPRLDAEGVPVHEVAMRRGISVVSDIASVFSMVRVLRSVRPAVVHSYTPKAGLVAMLASWMCRVPVRVHTFTGLIFPTATGLRRHLLIWIDRLICACATHIVPEGRGVKNDLEAFRITRKPLKVIGHGNISGVDTAWFDPAREDTQRAAAELRLRLRIPPNAFVFCFVGRLHSDKGIAELLAAFAEMPDDAHLVLVGGLDENGALREAQLRMISRHARIHMLGFVTDVRPALRASNVLVLPSYREGFPNAILQAGAMGLPAIATNINGCNEVVRHGDNGWLVPSKDSIALRSAMDRARALAAGERALMGERARQQVCERFEQARHWERMVQFYRALPARQEGTA